MGPTWTRDQSVGGVGDDRLCGPPRELGERGLCLSNVGRAAAHGRWGPAGPETLGRNRSSRRARRGPGRGLPHALIPPSDRQVADHCPVPWTGLAAWPPRTQRRLQRAKPRRTGEGRLQPTGAERMHVASVSPGRPRAPLLASSVTPRVPSPQRPHLLGGESSSHPREHRGSRWRSASHRYHSRGEGFSEPFATWKWLSDLCLDVLRSQNKKRTGGTWPLICSFFHSSLKTPPKCASN